MDKNNLNLIKDAINKKFEKYKLLSQKVHNIFSEEEILRQLNPHNDICYTIMNN